MNESYSKSPVCRQCGAEAPDAPAGLCPRCLMAEVMRETTAGDGRAAVPPLAPEELAPHFPQLDILECLGRGGMGVVYKARQKSLNRLVALKLLAPERADDPPFAARFEKEAHALAALNHPNIVGVHDFGQAGGFYFLLMEFVDGVNLRQAMAAGRFTPEQALAVVPPVCEALQYAHEHGIVHRDIKPENLLLDKDGRVKIADFGIAKILGTPAPGVGFTESQPAGTPQYMAPEQKEHGITDHRADIYSLGVVLYEMLTGELPATILQPPSKRVQVDVRIDEIVLRALEAKPELRFATATEFRTQVEAATQAAPSPQAAGASFTIRRVSAALTITAFFAGFIPLFLVLDFGFPLGNSGIAALGGMLVGLPFIMWGILAWCSRAAESNPDRKRQGHRVLLAGAATAGILGALALAVGVFFIVALLEQRGAWNPAPDEGVVVPLAWIGMLALPWAAAVLFRAGGRRPAAVTEPSRNLVETTAGKAEGPPRLSRAAIAGACWVPVTFLSFVAVAIATYQAWGATATAAAWWQPAILIPAVILGVTGPFGTTILGWVAVSRIRRSAGRIEGLRLAVFDGLVFPLMALSGIIALGTVALAKMCVDFKANPAVMGAPGDPRVSPSPGTRLANWLSLNTEIVVIVAVVAAVAVDILIVRAVLRAVRAPLGAGAQARAEGNHGTLASLALVLALTSFIIGMLAALRTSAPGPAMALSLVFAGLGIFMAMPARRLGAGKCALVIAGLGIILWPVITLMVPHDPAHPGASVGPASLPPEGASPTSSFSFPVTIEPERAGNPAGEESFLFGSLPPGWPVASDDRAVPAAGLATKPGSYGIRPGLKLVITESNEGRQPGEKPGAAGQLVWEGAGDPELSGSHEIPLSDGLPYLVAWRAGGNTLWVACGTTLGRGAKERIVRYLRILTVLGPGEVEERSVSDDELDADPANEDVHGAIPADVRRALEALDK